MSDSISPTTKAPLTLDQLVALNDELEALVRAGIPLERGLNAASGDYRGRLGEALRDLSKRLEAGERLPDAMARSGPEMPEVYRSILEAGLRSGRLADALGGMARIGGATLEARRTIALACFYPVLVLILAYGLFLFFLTVVFPRFIETAGAFRLEEAPIITILGRLGESVAYWGPLIPLLVLALGFAWVRSGRSRSLDGSKVFRPLVARLPWVGRMVANYRAANFTDLLAHLVDHEVPLDEAVRLAGNTSGNGSFRRSATRFAEKLNAGGTTSNGPSPETLAEFPPLVAWMLTSGYRQGTLPLGLRHLASAYRRKADRQAETFRVFLPGLLIVVIGSVAVLSYALLLFVPLRSLWDGLANPLN